MTLVSKTQTIHLLIYLRKIIIDIFKIKSINTMSSLGVEKSRTLSIEFSHLNVPTVFSFKKD